MTAPANPFDNPQHVETYAARAKQMVPAYQDVHRLATVLLAEKVPDDGTVLVLGGGGGLETKAFAEAHPGWTFDAVDPAEAMLDLATGIDPGDAGRAREAVESQVPVLSPEQDRSILMDAGFTDVTEYYTAFTFRGWVGYA